MFCPKCGAQNADGAKFCSGCGGPLPATGASSTSAASSPVASPVLAKSRRLKKPIVVGIVTVVIAVIVTLVVKSVLPGSAPAKTIHFGYGYSTSDGSFDYSNGFCFSVDGDSFALAWGYCSSTVTGKVTSTYETDDLAVWEVSPEAATGDSEGSVSVDGVRVALFAPKGASVGNPVGDWGFTVISEDSYRMSGRDVRSCMQYKLAVDQDGTYSFQYGVTEIDADDTLDSFESDSSELVDSSSLSNCSGAWAKTDKAGKYSLSFNDDEGTSGILELTDTTFGDLSEYYSDTPKVTLTD